MTGRWIDDGDPEFAFLVAAVADTVSERSPSDAVDTARLDWQYVHNLARRHGVVPLLDRYLDRMEEHDVPGAVRENVATAATEVGRINLQFAGVLHRLADSFEEAGVRAVPFKGPVLAEVAYGGLGLRQFTDLDFLVVREDIPAAVDLLNAFGYELETDLGPYSVPDLVDGGGRIRPPPDLALVDPETNVTVELRYTHDPDGALESGSLKVPALWRRRCTVPVAGRSCPALSPADRLVVLTTHGTKHIWRRLEWLADLAGVATRTDPDWETARALAADRQVCPEFDLGVVLVSTVFDVEIPDSVVRSARNRDVVCSTANAVLSRFVEQPMQMPSRVSHARLWARLRDEPVYRSVFTPVNVADYRFVTLPEPMWPLYRVLRPFRLGIKVITERGEW